MRFGSVCSGIEAASVAWNPLGWEAAWLAEIEPFPSAVLKHHYPEVPNYGDMTKLPERILAGDIEAPDLFCGGTPCQAFSVAGLRKSLEDARGNLSLTFCEIANAIDHVRRGRGEPPAVIFWENVPGVLSTKDNAFGCFISALAGCDTAVEPLAATGWTDAGVVAGPQRTVAWRILDAQYFGLAQRRRRVFVVASSREGFDPAAVLLEWEGLRRDSAPSREAGKTTPAGATNSAGDGGIVGALYAGCGPNGHGGSGLATLQGAEQGHLQVAQPYAVANCLTQRMHKGINTTLNEGQTPVLQPLAFDVGEQPYLGHCLRSGASKADKHESTTYIAQPVGIFQDSEFGVAQYDSAGTLRAGRIPEHQMVLQPAIAWDEELNASVEQAGTLLRGGHGGRHDGVAVAVDTYNHTISGNIAGSLTTTGGPPLSGPGVLQPVPMINMQGSKGNAVAQADGPSFTLNAMHGHDIHAVAVPVAFHPTQDPISSKNISHSISSVNGQGCATAAMACEIADTLSVGANQTTGFASDICAPTAMQVRRLTPVECERLQGFPDNYTAIPWRKKPASECPDGPRYKALGNSWAVPCVRWIGKRIQKELCN